MDQWQLDQIKVALDPRHPEVLIIRTRSGSKTFDMMLALLYLSWLGLVCNFFVSKGPQLQQPKLYLQYFRTNTFLRYSIISRKSIDLSIIFKSGGIFRIVHLTESHCRSLRGDVNYFDEESQAEQKALDASTPILAHSKLAKTIHGSTPQKGTPFEKNYQRLRQEGAPILSRKWFEVGFINQALIERDRKSKPAWWFRQEYECSFEAPMGKVFENVIEGNYDQLYAISCIKSHPQAGLDWNPSAGHWLGVNQLSDDGLKNFVLSEKNLGTDMKTVFNFIFQWHLKHPDSYIEVEDGGTNAGFCDALEMIARDEMDDISWIVRREWDSQGRNKMNSITCTYDTHIYVDLQKTPDIGYWLDVAHWDDTSDTPKVEKDPDQHPLDCGLHAFFRSYKEHTHLEMEWV